MPESKALDWIEEHHKKISRTTFYRVVGKLAGEAEKRRDKFIMEGLFKKHIDAIDRLEKMISMAFDRIEKCDALGEYSNATAASNSVARLQEILTSYYDEIQDVIEYDNDKQKENPSVFSQEAQTQQNVLAFTAEYGSGPNRPIASN